MTVITGGDLRKAMVFHAIWTANVHHITNSPANMDYGKLDKGPPVSELRSISVLALANSLRMPYESVRRYAEALRRDGICARHDGEGLTINPDFLERTPDRDRIIQASYLSFVEFLADLRHAGFDFQPYMLPASPALGEQIPMLGRAIMRLCSAFVMRTTESLTQSHRDDYIAALIHTALYAANLREHFKAMPSLGADDALLPAREFLRPVSVRMLAGRIRLPFETVRRHCTRMREGVEVFQIGRKGLVVSLDLDEENRCGEAVRRICFDAHRLMGELHRNGLNIHTPAAP